MYLCCPTDTLTVLYFYVLFKIDAFRDYMKIERYFLLVVFFAHLRKMSKYGVISGSCFPVFGLHTELYGVTSTLEQALWNTGHD